MIARLIPFRRVWACPPVSRAKVYPGYTPGAADVVGSANTRTQACSRDKWHCDGNGIVPARSRHGRALLGTAPQARRTRRSHHRGRVAALGSRRRASRPARCWQDVSTLTLGALLDAWHTDIVQKTYRRPREVRGYIERLDPAAEGTKVRNLERVEVRHALRRYAEERGPIAANRAFVDPQDAAALRRRTPATSRSPRRSAVQRARGGAETSRDRVLTDEELRRLWQTSSPHAPLLRFLLLTGQRIVRRKRARWSYVHGDRWHIPKEHSKNHRAHLGGALTSGAPRCCAAGQSRELCPVGHGTGVGVAARWWRARELAGIRVRTTARTCATRLTSSGVPPAINAKDPDVRAPPSARRWFFECSFGMCQRSRARTTSARAAPHDPLPVRSRKRRVARVGNWFARAAQLLIGQHPVTRGFRAPHELVGQPIDGGDLDVAGVDGEAQRGLEDRQGTVSRDRPTFLGVAAQRVPHLDALEIAHLGGLQRRSSRSM